MFLHLYNQYNQWMPGSITQHTKASSVPRLRTVRLLLFGTLIMASPLSRPSGASRSVCSCGSAYSWNAKVAPSLVIIVWGVVPLTFMRERYNAPLRYDWLNVAITTARLRACRFQRPRDVSAKLGIRCAQGRAASNAAAARRTIASAKRPPTICSPTGRPSAATPQGTVMAGWPVRLNG